MDSSIDRTSEKTPFPQNSETLADDLRFRCDPVGEQTLWPVPPGHAFLRMRGLAQGAADPEAPGFHYADCIDSGFVAPECAVPEGSGEKPDLGAEPLAYAFRFVRISSGMVMHYVEGVYFPKLAPLALSKVTELTPTRIYSPPSPGESVLEVNARCFLERAEHLDQAWAEAWEWYIDRTKSKCSGDDEDPSLGEAKAEATLPIEVTIDDANDVTEFGDQPASLSDRAIARAFKKMTEGTYTHRWNGKEEESEAALDHTRGYLAAVRIVRQLELERERQNREAEAKRSFKPWRLDPDDQVARKVLEGRLPRLTDGCTSPVRRIRRLAYAVLFAKLRSWLVSLYGGPDRAAKGALRVCPLWLASLLSTWGREQEGCVRLSPFLSASWLAAAHRHAVARIFTDDIETASLAFEAETIDHREALREALPGLDIEALLRVDSKPPLYSLRCVGGSVVVLGRGVEAVDSPAKFRRALMDAGYLPPERTAKEHRRDVLPHLLALEQTIDPQVDQRSRFVALVRDYARLAVTWRPEIACELLRQERPFLKDGAIFVHGEGLARFADEAGEHEIADAARRYLGDSGFERRKATARSGRSLWYWAIDVDRSGEVVFAGNTGNADIFAPRKTLSLPSGDSGGELAEGRDIS